MGCTRVPLKQAAEYPAKKYDYRYSVLIGVFARLLYEGWLSEQDLAGLSPEKLELIRRGAGTTRELDA